MPTVRVVHRKAAKLEPLILAACHAHSEGMDNSFSFDVLAAA